ncbi:MAG TPA: ferrochelatase [Burkholderiales bacterium]|nr:ferrochelatase [Burkholderiales bacterium]
MAYRPEPSYAHGTRAAIGVLLINLGTPQAPDAPALRRYLKQFLSDPRVIEIPRALWWPILHGIVLRMRPRRSAAKYARIWTPEGSPLAVHTERQTKMLRGYLGERIRVPLVVEFAMRYGAPSVADAIERLKQAHCDRVLAVPLYPQYSASASASALDAVGAALARLRNVPALRTIRHFHDHPGYIGALAQSVRDHWLKTGRPERLVMSFHGLPRFQLERGDPYHCECHMTARLVAEALALAPADYTVCFQSRFGRAQWLEPYTAQVLAELGRQKLKRVDVLCPGFVSDCLETLEEIGMEGKATFLNAGGGEFHLLPCLNERDDWLRALTDLVLANLLGWTAAAQSPEALDASRQRAVALGAKQ